LAAQDPAAAAEYAANAEQYIAGLNALDQRIQAQVATIPEENRKLVTDHDTLGYYADRYGLQVVGMIVPSVSSADSTTARGLAALIDSVKATNARAIFIEELGDPRLAEQISTETGAKVVTGLYTHSLSAPDGPAPTYLQMLEYDTQLIVDALR
jgi:ABC-type Zn uptake system ZnuABC Zn-binding protein ZnuA